MAQYLDLTGLTYYHTKAKALFVAQSDLETTLADYAKTADLANVYTYKGTVDSYADLPADASVGDVYNVTAADADNDVKAGDNVAWNGTEWDNLSGIVDLSNYVTADDLEAIATTDIDTLFA